jgi:hypothetical protein
LAYSTLREIVDNVIIEAGLVAGSAVQTYTEPMAIMAVNNMFDILWRKEKWAHLWTWVRKTIDPATGKFTTTLDNVQGYEDIADIRLADNRGRSVAQSFDNRHLEVTGSSALFWTALEWDDPDFQTKLIQFWPIGATGDVDVLRGKRPNKFEADNDIVPFDRTVIQAGALWYLLADDGLNPASADKALMLYEAAYQDYMAWTGQKNFGFGSGPSDDRTVYIRPS